MLQSLANYLKWVLSKHPTRNNFKIFAQDTFFKGFFRENIGDFTDLHNEKKSIWKLRVNKIVSITGTRVNDYRISYTWQPYLPFINCSLVFEVGYGQCITLTLHTAQCWPHAIFLLSKIEKSTYLIGNMHPSTVYQFLISVSKERSENCFKRWIQR